MSITIELPAGTEARIRAHASATGKGVETLVIEAVEAKLSLANLGFRELLAPVREDFRNSGMTEQDLDGLIDEARDEVWSAKKAASGPSA